MIVIADATPLNYLVLIGHSDILPRLFDHTATTTQQQQHSNNRIGRDRSLAADVTGVRLSVDIKVY